MAPTLGQNQLGLPRENVYRRRLPHKLWNSYHFTQVTAWHINTKCNSVPITTYWQTRIWDSWAFVIFEYQFTLGLQNIYIWFRKHYISPRQQQLNFSEWNKEQGDLVAWGAIRLPGQVIHEQISPIKDSYRPVKERIFYFILLTSVCTVTMKRKE